MYGTKLSKTVMTYPEIARANDGGANSDSVYSFALGITFDTPNGPTAVEALEVGDLVRDNTGEFRTVLWLSEKRTSSQERRSSGGALDPDGRRTRFPGVRFVRGRPSDVVIQLMFGAEMMAEPHFSSQQNRADPDYVAPFASSRRRDDDKRPDQALAAE